VRRWRDELGASLTGNGPTRASLGALFGRLAVSRPGPNRVQVGAKSDLVDHDLATADVDEAEGLDLGIGHHLAEDGQVVLGLYSVTFAGDAARAAEVARHQSSERTDARTCLKAETAEVREPLLEAPRRDRQDVLRLRLLLRRPGCRDVVTIVRGAILATRNRSPSSPAGLASRSPRGRPQAARLEEVARLAFQRPA